MNRTKIENEIVYFGEMELTGLLKALIHNYKFWNSNQPPKKVVFPAVVEVDGVPIEMATATTSTSPTEVATAQPESINSAQSESVSTQPSSDNIVSTQHLPSPVGVVKKEEKEDALSSGKPHARK